MDQHLRAGFLLGSESGLDIRRRLAHHEAEIVAIEREAAALRQRLHSLVQQVGHIEAVWQGDDGWHH